MENNHEMSTLNNDNNNTKSTEGLKMMRKGRVCEVVVRVVASLLTLVAAVTLGADQQTKIVAVKLPGSLPPFNVPLTAKWHHLSAFLYFVVINGMASGYAAISVVVGLAGKGGKVKRVIAMVDVMVAWLFSGNGAAMAVGLVGLQGNSHLHWNKVCNVFGKFCEQVEAALAFPLLASSAFLFLLLLPLFRLHNANSTSMHLVKTTG